MYFFPIYITFVQNIVSFVFAFLFVQLMELRKTTNVVLPIFRAARVQEDGATVIKHLPLNPSSFPDSITASPRGLSPPVVGGGVEVESDLPNEEGSSFC
jgi:hypothetical protein